MPLADPIQAALARTRSRLGRLTARGWMRWYALSKLAMDPVYRAVAARVPAGAAVVDLGCGPGLAAVLLAELDGGRAVLGVEWDGRKLAAARRIGEGLPGLTLLQADLREQPLPPCDAVLLLDVLHYFPLEAQRAVLARCADTLRPGGRLLLREQDAAARQGFGTRALERLSVRLGWNRASGVHLRCTKDLAGELEALGLRVEELQSLASGALPGNALLVARKEDA